MKEKLQKVGKVAGGVCCTIIGLALAGFGVKQFIPEQKYIGGNLPNKETNETEPTSGRYPWGSEE